MESVKLTVRLPRVLHNALRKKAREEGRSLNQTIVEGLWRALTMEISYESERDRVRRVLRERGLLASSPSWLDAYIAAAPEVTPEEVRAAWAGQRPLSKDIIADRGE